MAISETVQSCLFEGDANDQQLIRIPIRAAEAVKSKQRRRSRRRNPPTERCRLLWTIEEHDRFLHALELYPAGPWKAIADYIGTRTPRQTMTHAQKYREKIERRKLKTRKESISSSSEGSSSGDEAIIPVGTEKMTKAAATMLDEALELPVLLEFVNNFQPSEIECTPPLLYARDTLFAQGASF
ncbi:hypothetical protein V7S43_012807 [Phytophthora oleae]|uniref:Myb-like DNA-binding protein n=1 Tax=Phytophthora oleae TaxID=2107226 RepID=A0ABD3F7P5_9STRA